MSLVSPFRYFISPANTLDIFYLSTSFLKTPLVYVFLGFILFLMKLHLHKFMILTWLFIYSQSRNSCSPRASRKDLEYFLGNYHEIVLYVLLTRKLDPLHFLHPCVMTPISHRQKTASTQPTWVVAHNSMQVALITQQCKAAVEFHPGPPTRLPIRRIAIRASL